MLWRKSEIVLERICYVKQLYNLRSIFIILNTTHPYNAIRQFISSSSKILRLSTPQTNSKTYTVCADIEIITRKRVGVEVVDLSATVEPCCLCKGWGC